MYKGDTQWQVVQRSLGMFADQAGLRGSDKTAFVGKWTKELEQNGQTSIYGNSTGMAKDDAGFTAKIDKTGANAATDQLGTFQMMIRPNVQTGMIGDLRALRRAELSAANIVNPQLRKEVKTFKKISTLSRFSNYSPTKFILLVLSVMEARRQLNDANWY